MSVMMNVGRAGARTFQEQINTNGHNIANSTTTGFKKTFNNIKDLAYFEQSIPGGTYTQGVGSRGDQTGINFRQGEITESGIETHYAIDGEGYFGVQDSETNQVKLTRNGIFTMNEAGQLADQNGNLVMTRTVVDADGVAHQEPAMYRPSQSTAQLNSMTNGYFQIDPDDLISNLDGDDGGFGTLHRGALESSNVDLSEEMTDLMIAQRAYSMNMRVISTADETKQMINNLR